MNSAFVTRRLRSIVWSELMPFGFEARGRSAWRSRGDSEDVITFRAVGNYSAGVLRVEPHSFELQLGVWLDYARPSLVLAPGESNIPDPDRPDEAGCPFRRTLTSRRPAAPDPDRPRFSGVEPVWSLSQDPSEVERAIADALEALRAEGLPWFDRLADPREVHRTLREESEVLEVGGTWGFGRFESPARMELTEAVESFLDE